MSADIIAKALHGKTSLGWIACCPAHDDRTPSLSISDGDDGRVLVHCHAGCEQAQVITALRSRGLWNDERDRRFKRPAPLKAANRRLLSQDRDNPERTVAALAIWRSAALANCTPVETYLVSRGLRFPPPATLRFRRGLKHPSGGIWPAMVALVTRGIDDIPIAIHRVFLARDGTGKAPLMPQKMMLGPCRGGAVRLGPAAEVLMVGEGIETCLAAMQASGKPAWAALSTSGMRALKLPDSVREVIILADGDEAGEAAARAAALRWGREGRRVHIARPPQGLDFNDWLLDRAPSIKRVAAA